jgi:hypothetical protein
MLRFFTVDEAHSRPYRAEFRYPLIWTAIALALTIVLAVAAIIGATRLWSESWLGAGILGWLSLWFLIFFFILRSVLRARLRPTNWLVRVTDDGLLVKFRSYLNYHFASDDKIVLHLSFSDVEWIREHKVQRTIPGGAGTNPETSRQRYVELKVNEALAEELERHLAQERLRKGPMRPKWRGNGYSFSRHYPLQIVEKELVRIEWGVRPRIGEFLNQIQPYIAVRQGARTSIDFRELESVSRAEQEARLVELVETGDRMKAVRAARHLYKMNLTEAVRFVEDLKGQHPSKPDRAQ